MKICSPRPKKSRLSEISGNTNIGKIGDSIKWTDKGKTVEEAATKLEIESIIAWAIILKDKDDLARMKEFSRIKGALKGELDDRVKTLGLD